MRFLWYTDKLFQSPYILYYTIYIYFHGNINSPMDHKSLIITYYIQWKLKIKYYAITIISVHNYTS